jgi:hypothetical protein
MTQEAPSFDRHDQILMGLVLNLQTSAMVQMGKITDPMSGELDRNLDAARMSIDVLDALKVKTTGNMPEEIAVHLEKTVMELQLNFMDESKKEEASEQTEPATDSGNEEKAEDESVDES